MRRKRKICADAFSYLLGTPTPCARSEHLSPSLLQRAQEVLSSRVVALLSEDLITSMALLDRLWHRNGSVSPSPSFAQIAAQARRYRCFSNGLVDAGHRARAQSTTKPLAIALGSPCAKVNRDASAFDNSSNSFKYASVLTHSNRETLRVELGYERWLFSYARSQFAERLQLYRVSSSLFR